MRPLTGPTTTPRPRWRSSTIAALVAVVALVLAGCGSDDGDDESTGGESTTETTAAESTETDPATTEASTSDPTTSTTTEAGGETSDSDPITAILPGEPCSLEEGLPDCIDPDGDGEGTYLTDGDECAATAPDISVCADLDGDGVAGYPDEFEDLPTCSEEVPPPCNNAPGSQEE